ncbi:MAG: type II toxin-antitoxin system Phd/YefM family antitoxin [Erysipelotrichaceae bacterium]|nr:type II toxin-antitoxin system Phd/YefM family antitoxin [Erysipelotrichaceae bacterium]
MLQSLPKVIPINELKNTAQITKTCQESDVPIIVTKNGYGEMVLMSIPLYEKTMVEAQAAMLVNEALDEIDAGAEPVEGHTSLASMKEKYGK